jgi:hypothetical protein
MLNPYCEKMKHSYGSLQWLFQCVDVTFWEHSQSVNAILIDNFKNTLDVAVLCDDLIQRCILSNNFLAFSKLILMARWLKLKIAEEKIEPITSMVEIIQGDILKIIDASNEWWNPAVKQFKEEKWLT